MDIKKFKRDLNKKPYCIELFKLKNSVGAIYPEHVDEFCPIETEIIQRGVYLIMSGGIHVIADDYSVEW